MSTQVNPVVQQQPKRELTQAEVDYFFHEVLDRTNEQLSPGKLVANKKNLEALFKSADQHMVKITWTLLQTFQYAQAVGTLTNVFVQAVKHIMFDLPSPLEWSAPHPAVIKRRALEAEQSGKAKPVSNDEGQTKWAQATEKAKEDDAKAKREAKFEKDVSDLIARVHFINPRSQSPDYKRIDDLKTALRDDVQKARKNGHSWGKIHAFVVTKINAAYRQDEKQREQWNSR